MILYSDEVLIFKFT